MMVAALLLIPMGWGAAGTEEAGMQDLPEAGSEQIPDEIVVGFRGPIPADFGSWVEAHDGEILIRDDVLHWASVRLADARASDTAIQDAMSRSDVRYAQHDAYAYTMGREDAGPPNDPMYLEQWGFPAIHAPEAWAVQAGSHDVKVAVVDTGLDVHHPDLQGNVCGPHESFVPDEPTMEDLRMHGTHVAGTVGAVADNGIGGTGTAQTCLMGVKVLNRFGQGQWSWIAAGIRWAVDNGADVVSMSLGGVQATSAVEDAVNYAYAGHEKLVVAAAGNTACFPPQDRVLYPAKYPAVMAVASLAPPGNVRSSFSSCGPSVEIAAPGSHVLSTLPGGGYASWSGTSMATPHVSGTAALMLAEHPGTSGAVLRCVLAATSDGMPGPLPKWQTGWGRLNAHQAVTLGAGDPAGLNTPGFSPDNVDPEGLLVNNCLGGTVFAHLGIDPSGLPLS